MQLLITPLAASDLEEVGDGRSFLMTCGHARTATT